MKYIRIFYEIFEKKVSLNSFPTNSYLSILYRRQKKFCKKTFLVQEIAVVPQAVLGQNPCGGICPAVPEKTSFLILTPLCLPLSLRLQPSSTNL